ncbi:hypothetical protein [Filimonas effusa]|uniref:Uncharacterized protein n=1 Tax=Filimonas effusa TaxID=2508721 RepID=A0A4V1MA15_9BACT|nr:hypothetical protein [Filimonas effusa]RXK83594.1 hypothetical protein ESB13_16030 [Filimonas effusa]
MKASIFSILICALSASFCLGQNYSPEISEQVAFLKTQHTSAKDYILGLFKKHDIVVLCERHHGELTQYDLIYDIVSSKAFQKEVGTVFTEVGSIDNRQKVQEFIHTSFKTEEQKRLQQLDTYRGMAHYGIWEMTNFYTFIGKLNTLNTSLGKNEKLELFVSDIRHPNSGELASVESVKSYFKNIVEHRDSLMAQNIIATFDSLKSRDGHKKALVIMNYRHAFSKSFDIHYRNTGDYLKEKYRDAFANVLINTAAPLPQVSKESQNKPKIYQDMSETLIQDGKWDAAFQASGKDDIGFDFKNAPLGKDHFDLFPFTQHQETYEGIFTGFVFYLPLEKHMDSYGVTDLVKGYEEELYTAAALKMRALDSQPVSIESLKEISRIQTEKSYDDLEKMLMMRNRWLESKSH